MPQRVPRSMTAVGAALVLLLVGSFASSPTSAAPTDSPGRPAAVQAFCGVPCFTLTVDLHGTGSGSWVSTSNGVPDGNIDCELVNGVVTNPSACSFQYKDFGPGISVHFTVGSAPGSTMCTTFCAEYQWSSTISLTSDYTDSRWTFTLKTQTLHLVYRSAGSVASSPGSLKCGSGYDNCDEAFPTGTQVTLTPTPYPGYVFTGWAAGPCNISAPTCTVTMDIDWTVDALFAEAPPPTATPAATARATPKATASPTAPSATATPSGPGPSADGTRSSGSGEASASASSDGSSASPSASPDPPSGAGDDDSAPILLFVLGGGALLGGGAGIGVFVARRRPAADERIEPAEPDEP